LSGCFCFLMEKLLTSIKGPASVLPSWPTHQSPERWWLLLLSSWVANKWAFHCRRNIFFSWFTDGGTSRTMHSLLSVGSRVPSANHISVPARKPESKLPEHWWQVPFSHPLSLQQVQQTAHLIPAGPIIKPQPLRGEYSHHPVSSAGLSRLLTPINRPLQSHPLWTPYQSLREIFTASSLQ
jgi:hypothetical protein